METINSLSPNNLNSPLIKKGLLALIGIVIISLVIVLASLLIKNSRSQFDNTGGYFEVNFKKNDDYSDMLNVYYNLPSEAPESYFSEILAKGDVDESFIRINRDGGESFISATAIGPDTNLTEQNVEYVSFDYIPAYDSSTVPMVENVTYHCFHDGKHDYIFESTGGEFTHVSGDLSNTYNNKTFAIDSYLMTL